MQKFMKLTVAVMAIALIAVPALADTLKVGVQAPITGSYANEGQGIENGVRLLAEQINAKGGVLGRPLEVIVKDSGGSPEKAVSFAKQLIEEDLANGRKIGVRGTPAVFLNGKRINNKDLGKLPDLIRKELEK